MKNRCTITLTIALLGTACQPIHYEPTPARATCQQALAHLAQVEQQRRDVTINDVVWFVADFGAGNNTLLAHVVR